MNIVVLLKQVLDNTKMQFDGTTPTGGAMLNPFDEYAVETAIRAKEAAGADATVTAISLGEPAVKDLLKKAIAIGADAAHVVSNEGLGPLDAAARAKVLTAAIQKLAPDCKLVVCGQSALDTNDGQTGPRVAEALGAGCITFAKALELAGDSLKVTRETERGVETHELNLPGVVCTMKCDYEMRSSNIKGVMKANKTEIPVHTVADLGLDAGALAPQVAILGLSEKPAKAAGQKVDGSDPQAAAQQLLGYLESLSVV